MITVKGYIDRIIFRNPDNGYTVMRLSTDDGDITVVGLLSMAGEGELVTAEGDITYHSGYGEQLEAERITVQEPDNKEAVLRFLSSGIVKGIGPALAKRIVRLFGDDTFAIMSREPERLSEVKGISLGKAVEISESFERIAGMRRAVMFLQQYGISNLLSLRIYEKYGEKLYEIISENPYRLCGDISGIGFKTADEIAERAGIERHSEYRIRAGILYALDISAGEGNTYLPLDILLRESASVLGLPENEISAEISSLQEERKAEIKQRDGETRVYLRNLYQAERQCAAILRTLDIKYDLDRDRLAADIERTEERYSLTLDTDQREAVISAVANGLFIMTGGPGTGKTTTVKILLKYFMSAGMHVSLAAPTGRAAKRLSEATGMEAKTIHRLLEVAGGAQDDDSDRRSFGRDRDNPLETDVVIVDEMSMVDILLFRALLSAIPAGTRLIMVGDENQLPSVGPGSVLKDILSTGKFKSIALNKIFRQAEKSDIVMNAHALLAGRDMKLD
ncbi:MAG: AAA family ATPase, partial [Lachnospiraceae bacterium]|nr:AAA family ATPase [Lachnospiraceae bacterium]